MPYDYLIVGAGLFGATFAHEATGRGLKCLVIDRRPHIGGNVYCENIEGINVHKYGAHIFHTSDPETWKFVNDIVPFNRFTNSPLALAPDGKLYNLPFNMNTFYQLWGERDPRKVRLIINAQRREAIDRMRADGVTEPRNLEEQALTLVGQDVYRLLIKEYTEKQWGRRCTELPAFIIRRLPLRFTFDNNYFNDAFQGIPVGGYNPLIEGLLKGSDVVLDTDFFADRDRWQRVARRMLFTGKIDEFYGFRFGKLDYRTVRFETEVLDTPNYQGNAVINHTSASVPYTRVIEHKHFETFGDRVYDNPRTVVSREYSTEWHEGMEPFYPVNDEKNQALYERYRALADQEPDILFGGRLAEYKYYDMAPLIANARRLFKGQ
jgi:UDP-galactopyranose mutase